MLETHARTEILDLHQMEGTLFSLVREAEWYILNHTRRRFVIEGFGPRKEIPELPREAVREILLNAFAHRDWLSVASVQIDIYNDAVEVTNPGWFIAGQDPAEHLANRSASSLTRNALIAQTLYRCGDIEAFGSGIPRVRDLCKEAGVRIEYVHMADGTKFVFHRNDAFTSLTESKANGDHKVAEEWPKNGRKTDMMAEEWPKQSLYESNGQPLTLNSTQRRVLSFLEETPRGTTAFIAESTGIPQRTVRRALSQLIELGVVLAEGATSNRTYRLIKHQEVV